MERREMLRSVAAISLSIASVGSLAVAEHVHADEQPEPIDPTTIVEVTPRMIEEAQPVTGLELNINYNACGGVISNDDQSYKWDFFTASPENLELGDEIVYNASEDPRTGMGVEAFQFILDRGAPNTFTQAAAVHKEKTGNEDLDAMISLLHPLTLSEGMTVVNGDCRHDRDGDGDTDVSLPSPDLPVMHLSAGESVESIILTEEDFNTWNELRNKDAEFKFITLDLDITTTLEDGTVVNYVAIAMFADGCDNPIRFHESQVPPEEGGGSTTTTIPEEHPTTTVGPKNDSSSTPGGVNGQNGGSDTGEPGTPTGEGVGPSGQPVNADGTVGNEVRPVAPETTTTVAAVTTAHEATPATTSPQPESTNPAVVIDGTDNENPVGTTPNGNDI